MKPTISKEGLLTLHLTLEEIRLLHQALNEVCYGIDLSDDEFSSRLGVDRAEAAEVLQVFALSLKLFGISDPKKR